MKKSRLLGAVYVFIAYGLLSTINAQASVIISPVSATASFELSSTYDIGNTIDQSGLSAGFVDGVTNFDAYLADIGAGNPTHSYTAADNEWFTPVGITSATVNYDLGGVYSIDRLALWNEEFSGIGTLDILVSLDNINFTTVASDLRPVDNPRNVDYGAQIFGFGTQSARYIQFDVSNCPQPNGDPTLYCAIGEVAFSTSAVPIPAAVWLFGSGLLGLIGVARRKKTG